MKYSAHKRYKKGIKGRTVLLVIACVLFIGVVAGGLGVRFWYEAQLRPVTTQSSKVPVTIEKGATVKEIAALLEEKQVIRSAQAFEWYVRNKNLRDNIKAGSYQLDPSRPVSEVVSVITEGKVSTNLFTILPGQRLDQIEKAFIDAGFESSQVKEALKPENYKNHPALVAKPSDASLEGYLYPESFQTTSETTPATIVKQSLDEMAKALTPRVIDGFQQQGLGIHQGVTLASIVLKETSDPLEARKVSGVFLNRLNQDIPLGSDVTYQYIADITGQERSPFIDSPYNTRKYGGLPPGPIANVTDSALEAVAFPQETDFLFFVAGDDGKIYYSKTQQEHETLTAKYCKELCAVY
jgi:UPF0755 protein